MKKSLVSYGVALSIAAFGIAAFIPVTAQAQTTVPSNACSVAVSGVTYTLNPCSINLTMVDGQGNKNFTTTIIPSSTRPSYGYSVHGYGEGLPTYAILGASSGGAVGTTTIGLYFNDSVLSANGNQPQVYSGYLPIHVYQGSETGFDNIYLDLNVTLTVLPATSTQTSQPPVISGITAPTVLSVGQSGTWTIKAYDPQDGSLSYSILWGDENQSGTATKGAVANVTSQTTTFTHTYINQGTYTPTFTVTNSAGLSAKSSATVQVGGGTTTTSPCYQFTTNLSLGSTGADVVALQTWLMGAGFDIPAISSGQTAKGYFGTQTAQALAKYQANVGLKVNGVLDAATRAKLNASCTSTNQGLVIKLTSTPVTSDKGYAMDYKVTFDGSKFYPSDITLTLYCSTSGVTSYVTSPISEKGVCNDPNSGTNYGVDMNRTGDGVWDLLVVFTNISSQPQNVGAMAQAYGGSRQNPVATDKDAFTLPISGSTPIPVSGTQIITSLDPSSPLSSTVAISTSAQTQNVPLAVFNLGSQGNSSILQSLKVDVDTMSPNLKGNQPNVLFASMSIKIGSQTYYGTMNANDAAVVFNNMNVPLPANTRVPIYVYGNVAQDTNNFLDGFSAQVSLPTSGIQAADSNYSPVPTANNGSIFGNTITFTSGVVLISNTSATLGSPVSNQNGIQAYPVTFQFTLTAGNSTVYMGVTGGSATTVSIDFAGKNGNIVPAIPKGSVTANPSVMTGDNLQGFPSDYYVIPAGSSRQFTVNGVLNKSDASVNGLNTAQIIGIQYGTSRTNLVQYSITSGLDNLKIPVNFGGVTPVASNSVNATVIGASADYAGTSSFSPGKGSGYYSGGINGQPNDWQWQMGLNLGTTETISYIQISHAGTGQAWSTKNTSNYPLVVFGTGKGGPVGYVGSSGWQLNNSYGQTLGTYQPGTYSLYLFGQIDNINTPGTTIVVGFTDGTSVTGSIPMTTIRPVMNGGVPTT